MTCTYEVCREEDAASAARAGSTVTRRGDRRCYVTSGEPHPNHFAETLLHAPTRLGERRTQSWRLLVLNSGVALVVIGVPSRV